MKTDYRKGQKVIATIEIEDRGQDFIELDVLENGVILGNSIMFANGRRSLLGIGTNDGMEYHDFKEFASMTRSEREQLVDLAIYTYDTGAKPPLPWKADVLNYRVTKVKAAKDINRFVK